MRRAGRDKTSTSQRRRRRLRSGLLAVPDRRVAAWEPHCKGTHRSGPQRNTPPLSTTRSEGSAIAFDGNPPAPRQPGTNAVDDARILVGLQGVGTVQFSSVTDKYSLVRSKQLDE